MPLKLQFRALSPPASRYAYFCIFVFRPAFHVETWNIFNRPSVGVTDLVKPDCSSGFWQKLYQGHKSNRWIQFITKTVPVGGGGNKPYTYICLYSIKNSYKNCSPWNESSRIKTLTKLMIWCKETPSFTVTFSLLFRTGLNSGLYSVWNRFRLNLASALSDWFFFPFISERDLFVTRTPLLSLHTYAAYNITYTVSCEQTPAGRVWQLLEGPRDRDLRNWLRVR